MNLNRVQAGCVVENIGSMKAFEKAGFRKEGLLREAYFCDGEYRDVLIMGILKKEWRKGGI
jgi:RimJ/RimL family protein N-acetyltransferase